MSANMAGGPSPAAGLEAAEPCAHDYSPMTINVRYCGCRILAQPGKDGPVTLAVAERTDVTRPVDVGHIADGFAGRPAGERLRVPAG
jgi:hypothetical protein